MSEATERMRDFLTKSPSVVFPDEVLEIFEPIEQENASLRELVRDYHTFLTLAELAQPIGYVIAASRCPTLSVESLDRRYQELRAEVG